MKRQRETATLQDEHARQLNETVRYYQELEGQKRRHIEENKEILKKQMAENSARREKEKVARKEIVNTNYGPQETEMVSKLLKDKKVVE